VRLFLSVVRVAEELFLSAAYSRATRRGEGEKEERERRRRREGRKGRKRENSEISVTVVARISSGRSRIRGLTSL